MKGYSDRPNHEFGDILRTMCPTSPEAKCFKMGCNKLKYVVNHRLYPFITIMFDGSLNEIVQQSEMDVFVCFWDIDRHKVSSRFYNSQFLGPTTHLDVLPSLDDSIKKIDYTRMIQVSMDEPNTNLKVLEGISKRGLKGNYHNLLT